jgi:hypothetical protein
MSLRRVAQFFAHDGLVDSPTERYRNRFGNIEISMQQYFAESSYKILPHGHH